jgi:hypothetical protein
MVFWFLPPRPPKWLVAVFLAFVFGAILGIYFAIRLR